MAEVLKVHKPYLETRGEAINMVLLGAFYEIDGFYLRAFNEFEAYFDPPEPYLEIGLSSAAVITRIRRTNSILLVEFGVDKGGRRVELPAGKVERETDKTIFETAARELDQETGGLIAPPSLRPFAVRYHKDGRGGLQFYTEIPDLEVDGHDELGRGYLAPPIGTDGGRVLRLITEPLDVFSDSEKTLLRYSQNGWAVDEIVRLTLSMYIENMNRVTND